MWFQCDFKSQFLQHVVDFASSISLVGCFGQNLNIISCQKSTTGHTLPGSLNVTTNDLEKHPSTDFFLFQPWHRSFEQEAVLYTFQTKNLRFCTGAMVLSPFLINLLSQLFYAPHKFGLGLFSINHITELISKLPHPNTNKSYKLTEHHSTQRDFICKKPLNSVVV